MVTADEFGRSLRGVSALVQRRADGLLAFEMSLEGLRRSFLAIALTLPAYVVALALARRGAGLDPAGGLLDDPGLALAVGLGHAAAFLSLPLAMVPVARRFGLGDRYVPFVIVANWLWAYGGLALAAPGVMRLTGWETPALCDLFAVAVAALIFEAGRFATRATLGVGPVAAGAIVAAGFALNLGIGRLAALAYG